MERNRSAILGITIILLAGFLIIDPTVQNNSKMTFIGYATSEPNVVTITAAAASPESIVQNGFEISIIGEGFSSTNTISGKPGASANLVVQFNNSNSTYQSINLTLSGTGITSKTQNFSGNTTTTLAFRIPSATSAGYVTLNGTVNSSSLTIGSVSTRAYYTPIIPYEFCDDFSGEKGHLEIVSFNIRNNGAGDDEEWEYLDEIEIEIAVENTDNENINDVIVEIEIRDKNDNTITKGDLDLSDYEVDLGRIKDDDEEVAIFKIDELPIDLKEGDYRIFARAYEENNEENECTSESEDFTDSDETHFEFSIVESDGSTVIVKKGLEDVSASCGDRNVEVRFMVYNTADRDEEKVLVTLENSKLGIYEKVIIDDLRDKKSKEAVFFISVPKEVEKDINRLEIYTYYDYDDDEDELEENSYEESSEHENDRFSMLLEITSCEALIPTISSNFESTKEIGEELVIKASIKNNGYEEDFQISATDFESWAELVSIDPRSATINKGESITATITLMPKEAGRKSFKINAIIDEEIYSQSVPVNIKTPSIIPGISSTTLYLSIVIIIMVGIILLLLIPKKKHKR